ncbi:hypothetical protein AB0N06_33470 [Streptomyces sp. NPDC051020]|uniref:hypothetical protein n=1 Tax=Streptomyces sp. NPDC051020 TaxID=3155409 RepID=UPI00343FD6CB
MLGHVNLDHFAPQVKGGSVDRKGLEWAHKFMTRFLIRATYGDMTDDEQRHVMHPKRRVGVGHLGVHGLLAKQGVRYSEAPYGYGFRNLLNDLCDTVREYAFELRVPEPAKVTTVAPTGSIAKLPGVSEGTHPIYARHFVRRIRFSMRDPAQAATVQDCMIQGFLVEKDVYDQSGKSMVVAFPTKEKLVAEVEAMGYDAAIVESADEIDLNAMLAFQAMYQTYADNAVSYTVNFPEGKYSVDEAAAIIKSWLPDLKGAIPMPDGRRLRTSGSPRRSSTRTT